MIPKKLALGQRSEGGYRFSVKIMGDAKLDPQGLTVENQTGNGLGKSLDHIGAVDIANARCCAFRRGLEALPFVVGSGLIGFLLLGRLFARAALTLVLVLAVALLFAVRGRS